MFLFRFTWAWLLVSVALSWTGVAAGSNWVGNVNATITAQPSGQVVQSLARALHFSHDATGWTMAVTDVPEHPGDEAQAQRFAFATKYASSSIRKKGGEYQMIRLSQRGVTNAVIFPTAYVIGESGGPTLASWLTFCPQNELTPSTLSNAIAGTVSHFDSMRLHSWSNGPSARLIHADILSGAARSVITFKSSTASPTSIVSSLTFDSDIGLASHTTAVSEGTFHSSPGSVSDRLEYLLTNAHWHISDLRFLPADRLFYISTNDSFPAIDSPVTKSALSAAKARKSKHGLRHYGNNSWLLLFLLAMLVPVTLFARKHYTTPHTYE